MGAHGSCLGVGRPTKSAARPHFLPSNLISINLYLFGSTSGYKYDRQTDEDLEISSNDEQLDTTYSYTTRDSASSKLEFNRKLATESKFTSNIDECWYFGLVTRKVAEARLRAPGNTDGSFMIRHSETGGPGQFTLSVKHGNAVKHYRIICDKQHNQFFINKRKPFGSIADLIKHYKKSTDGLCIKLSQPCRDSYVRCMVCKHRRPIYYNCHRTKGAKSSRRLDQGKSSGVYEAHSRKSRHFVRSHNYIQVLTRYILAGTRNLFVPKIKNN